MQAPATEGDGYGAPRRCAEGEGLRASAFGREASRSGDGPPGGTVDRLARRLSR
jgi:hypothetical protein